jgi:flagellar motor component MotA
MDNQQLFNIIVCVGGFLAAYVLNMLTQRIQKMEDKMDNCVKKDDYKEDIKEVKDILKQIFEKLDNKADKS